MLYAKGESDLLKHPRTIAIVGTRNPTQEGVHVAYRLTQQWVRYGYVIVSGLARGIDTAAHKGALEAAGKTIAVLGTPLDTIYPAENKGLAEQIVKEGGLLLSELIAGQSGFRSAFVRRDHIQSGLSLRVSRPDNARRWYNAYRSFCERATAVCDVPKACKNRRACRTV
jgi:DNA processing protein